MSKIGLCVAAALSCTLLGMAGLALSSPVGGQRARLERDRIGALEERTIVERFRAGERACVIVEGDHKPVVDLNVRVLDEKGKLVAKDDTGGDLVAVVWYPPREANYTIRIKNNGVEYNDCYISFK